MTTYGATDDGHAAGAGNAQGVRPGLQALEEVASIRHGRSEVAHAARLPLGP